jgi:hypothetical protein
MPADLPAAFRASVDVRQTGAWRQHKILNLKSTRMRKILLALVALAPLAACGEPSTGVPYAVVTTATHDCARAPNASLDTSGGTIAFTGTCQRIRVKGGNNKITIAAAKAVVIDGANNVVEIDATDNVRARGAGNTIKFKRGLTVKRPAVVTTGDNSPIIQTH